MHKKSKKVKMQESGSSLSFINVEDEVFQRVKMESSIYSLRLDCWSVVFLTLQYSPLSRSILKINSHAFIGGYMNAGVIGILCVRMFWKFSHHASCS